MNKRLIKILVPVMMVLVFSVALVLAAQAQNSTCPDSGGGIQCTPSRPYLCGGTCVSSLPTRPQNPSPDNYTLDCDSCQWTCYGSTVRCGDKCVASQAGQTCDWSDAADNDDGKKDACGNCSACNTPTYLDCRDVNRGCARPDEFTTCAGANCNASTGECNSGFAMDSCGRCVSNVYTPVYLNYFEPQAGRVAISGDLWTANGDFYLGDSKAIRVDGLGKTSLNVGNWDANGEGVDMNVFGNLRAGDDKNYWQTEVDEISIDGSPTKIAALRASSGDGKIGIGAIVNGVAIVSDGNGTVANGNPLLILTSGEDTGNSMSISYDMAGRTGVLGGAEKYFIDNPLYFWGGEYIWAGKEDGKWGLNFAVNGVNRMTVANGGNVGVNTGDVAPASRLTVFGDAQLGDEKNYWKFNTLPITVDGQQRTLAMMKGISGDGEIPIGGIANGVVILAESQDNDPVIVLSNYGNINDPFTISYEASTRAASLSGASRYNFTGDLMLFGGYNGQPDSRINFGGGGEYIYSIRDENNPARWGLNFATGGQDQMVLNGGGLGIGTSQPQQRLDVNGGVRISGPANGTNDTLYNVNGELYWNGNKVSAGGSTPEQFWAKSGNNVVYTGNGNIGIGTDNPTQKLDVKGTILADNTNGTGSITAKGTSGWSYSSFILDSSDNNKWLLTHRDGGNTYPGLQHSLNIEYVSPNGFSYNGMLTIEAPTKDLSGLNPIIIRGDGNVMMPNVVTIGKLAVGSNSPEFPTISYGSVGGRSLVLSTNDQPRMIVTQNGNVGINNDNPQQMLDVNGAIQARASGLAAQVVTLGKGNGWDYANLILKADTGVGPNNGQTWAISHRQANGLDSSFQHALVFEYVDANNKGHDMLWLQAPDPNLEPGYRPLMIKSNSDVVMSGNLAVAKIDSGNIGITGSGSVNPEVKLNIWADNYWAMYGDRIGQGDLRFWNQNIPGDQNALVIKQSTGNVGIGVTNPTQKLEIAGNLKVQANTVSAAPTTCAAAEEGTIKYIRVGNVGHYYGCTRTSATVLRWRILDNTAGN